MCKSPGELAPFPMSIHATSGIAAVIFTVVSLAPALFAAPPDFNADLQRAGNVLNTLLPVSGELMNSRDFAGANAKLLAAFPEATRTPAESFMLGNVFFEIDRKQSYALHHAAVIAEPDNVNVVWEWAMEQHRAGEYAGALASYQQFSKARPKSAVPYALTADCLLHLNRIDEAIAAWRQSETAPSGSLETMENMVCAVKRDPMPHKRRADLLAKATADHDADAAAELIALDCDFPKDWWNAGVYEAYLAHDLPAVKTALKLPAGDIRFRAIACAAECATADSQDPAAITKILKNYKLLVDPDVTIPENSGLLSAILAVSVHAKAIDEATLHEKIAPKLLELARKDHDVQLWNTAAYASSMKNPDSQLKLEREGWNATGDARFAFGVLFAKSRDGKLTTDDADLIAALKQFPESGLVQRAAYEAAVRENKVTRELLAAAAKAEFKRFTSFVAPATVVNRPRSDYLRQYFAQMPSAPPAKNPAPN